MSLRFPASVALPAPPPTHVVATAPAPLAGAHVLLVDDDDAFRATLTDMLTREGLRVTAWGIAAERCRDCRGLPAVLGPRVLTGR